MAYITGILAPILFALMIVLIASFKGVYSTSQIIFFRSFFLILLTFKYLLPLKLARYKKEEFVYVIKRGLFGAIGILLMFANLMFAKEGNAVSFSMLVPLFIIVILYFTERKVPKLFEVIGLATILFAEIILKLKGFPELNFTIFILGITGAFFAALAFINLKKATKGYNSNTILFFFAFFTLFISVIPLFWEKWTMPSLKDLGVFGLIGLVTYSGHILITFTFKNLPVEKANIFLKMNLMWIALFSYLINGTSYTMIEILSYFLLTIGVIVTNLKK